MIRVDNSSRKFLAKSLDSSAWCGQDPVTGSSSRITPQPILGHREDFTVMLKTLTRFGVASALVAGGSIGLAGHADAAQRCAGSTYSGRCITTSNIVYHSTVVETVPLINSSRYTATMSCSFTRTVSRSYSNSVSLTAGLKASVWGVAEASVSGTQEVTLSQTASQATAAGGSVKLPPGGKVNCQRIYGYYTMTTKVDEWGPGAVDRTFTSYVPYSFGAKIVNG